MYPEVLRGCIVCDNTRSCCSGPNEVKVNLADGGEQTISTKNIMIATGSDASTVPGLVIDEKKCGPVPCSHCSSNL